MKIEGGEATFFARKAITEEDLLDTHQARHQPKPPGSVLLWYEEDDNELDHTLTFTRLIFDHKQPFTMIGPSRGRREE